jgi:preprotein translocase subunit YajC
MNGLGFLLIIVVFALLWLVMVRPQKRRQQEQRQMLDRLKVGDEVLTAAGIYGEVTALRDDDVMVEIAPNVEVRVARRAIGGVVPAAEEDEAPPAPAEPEEAEVEAPAEAAAAEAPADEHRG